MQTGFLNINGTFIPLWQFEIVCEQGLLYEEGNLSEDEMITTNSLSVNHSVCSSSQK
jgi:hypothetical protein